MCDPPAADWKALAARPPDALAVASPDALHGRGAGGRGARAAGARAVVALPALFEFVAAVLVVRLIAQG